VKHSVFISHSSKDKAIADKVCDFLEANGISCWIAPRDVTPGKNYGLAIIDAIDECAVFVLILTRESNKSGQVVREAERAASANAIIIPFRVEDVQPSRNLEFYVGAAHWLDAVTKPLEKHLSELLKAIQNWQRGDVPSEERPARPVVQSPAITSSRRRWFTISSANRAGVVLLAVYLICIGLVRLFAVDLGILQFITAILGLVAGIFILIGRLIPASAITSDRRRWFTISSANLAGTVLLAVFLIVIGIIGLTGIVLPGILLTILALAAGIFILIGR
jgi:hypothetical protein